MAVVLQIIPRFNSVGLCFLRNYTIPKTNAKILLHSPLKRAGCELTMSTAAQSTTTSNIGSELAGSSEKSTGVINRDKKMSRAMKAYLERAQQYDEFMKEQVTEYEIGKRHLANMMGEDPDTFTEEDINEAIQYLMPSGLYEPRARPLMKHPSQVFHKQKAAEFDDSGRPFHCFYYTRFPNYYDILYKITEKMLKLNEQEDNCFKMGIMTPDPTHKVNLSGTRWLTKVELENVIVEKLKDREYDKFLMCATRLVEHPYSNQEKDFIRKYRAPLVAEMHTMEIPELKYDENKRPYMDATGYRKKTVAHVIVRGNGSGKMLINGTDMSFFTCTQDREQLMFPLHFTGLLNKVDVEAKVVGVGNTAQSGAIRYGISLALRSFVTKEMVEKMRIAGLLTRDPRKRERKKPGQEGARRKYTWKKR